MRKKIIATILSCIVLFSEINVVCLASGVDYTNKISELQALVDKCADENISTDYEQVNISTLNLFNNYINQDISQGVSDENVNYNISCMDELYNETKSNLEGYLSGKRTAYEIERPDMMNLKHDGIFIKDQGGKPVFSIGYGHSNDAWNAVPQLQDFGADNIQAEIYPNAYFQKQLSKWDIAYHDTDADFDCVSSTYCSGKQSLKIKNNTENSSGKYVKLTQKIPCKKYARYKIGYNVKGNIDVNGMWLSANGFSDRNYVSVTETWTNNEFTYRSKTTQEQLDFTIVLEDKGEVYLDDIFVYEVDSSGNKLSENLVENGSFEEEYDYSKNVGPIKNILQEAQANNIAVSLLLSPHIFPDNVDGVTYTDADYLYIKYNIDMPKAREIIEKYLRGVLPELTEYSSLNSICLTNEPVYNTMLYPDYYNPLFRDYLKGIYNNSISVLNEKCGTSYNSFESISITDVVADSGLVYDRINFNDKVFTDWHKWIVSIVREYLPSTPIHCKVMNYFGVPNDDDGLVRGTDIELFSEFCDYAGCDSWDYIDDVSKYYEEMFYYDYMRTVIGKPIYNSEDHIIRDYSEDYSLNQRKHWINNLWMGAVHGRSMSTIWNWERGMVNSPLYRPDIIAATGKTKLDLTRLSDKVSRLMQNESNVAIMYSKPSRMYDSDVNKVLFNTYEALLELGIHPGIVSDKSIQNLSQYDILILPKVTHAEERTRTKIEAFIASGGTVVYCGNPLIKDEYNQIVNNQIVKDKGVSYFGDSKELAKNTLMPALIDSGNLSVTLIDEATGQAPSDVDWSYTYEDNALLLNITSLKCNDIKNINVYENGIKVCGMEDLISHKLYGDKIRLEGYTPLLLKFVGNEAYPHNEIKNISIDKNQKKITWESTQDVNMGIEVYSVNLDGSLEYLDNAEDNCFNYSDNGSYIITPLNIKNNTPGKIVTVSDMSTFATGLNNVRYVDGILSCDVLIKNNLKSFAAGDFIISVVDSLSKEKIVASYKITLRGKEETKYRVSLNVGSNIEEVRLYGNDEGIGGNHLSSPIKENVK